MLRHCGGFQHAAIIIQSLFYLIKRQKASQEASNFAPLQRSLQHLSFESLVPCRAWHPKRRPAMHYCKSANNRSQYMERTLA